MVFQSIIYLNPHETKTLDLENSQVLRDLNLDLAIKEICKDAQDESLKKWFLSPLKEIDEIRYRQEVFIDLESQDLIDSIKSFSKEMRSIMMRLESLKDLYDLQREGWFLLSVNNYLNTLSELQDALKSDKIKSRAFLALKGYLETYISSKELKKLSEEAEHIAQVLLSLKYRLQIGSNRVTVQGPVEISDDYSNTVRKVFSGFRDVTHKKKDIDMRQFSGGGYLQSEILKLIEKIYPKAFSDLRGFMSSNNGFVDQTVIQVFRELQFYLSYLNYIAGPKSIGLDYCIPKLTAEGEIHCSSLFDTVMAVKAVKCREGIVTNDFIFGKDERILVITGPNNGGKTTFARSIGQMFYLSSLGLPVPCKEARIGTTDGIYTHFERMELVENLRGKLEDDIVRIKSIIDESTGDSLIIINEMLSSTTVDDALLIGTKVMEMIIQKGAMCVFVTFLDELSNLPNTVSMVAQVNPENPEERTFKILRQQSDGLAYAHALSSKYRVSYEDLRERIKVE